MKLKDRYIKLFKEARPKFYVKGKFFTSRPVSSIKTGLAYALDDEDAISFDVHSADTDELIRSYTRKQAEEIVGSHGTFDEGKNGTILRLT